MWFDCPFVHSSVSALIILKLGVWVMGNSRLFVWMNRFSWRAKLGDTPQSSNPTKCIHLHTSKRRIFYRSHIWMTLRISPSSSLFSLSWSLVYSLCFYFSTQWSHCIWFGESMKCFFFVYLYKSFFIKFWRHNPWMHCWRRRK